MLGHKRGSGRQRSRSPPPADESLTKDKEVEGYARLGDTPLPMRTRLRRKRGPLASVRPYTCQGREGAAPARERPGPPDPVTRRTAAPTQRGKMPQWLPGGGLGGGAPLDVATTLAVSRSRAFWISASVNGMLVDLGLLVGEGRLHLDLRVAGARDPGRRVLRALAEGDGLVDLAQPLLEEDR